MMTTHRLGKIARLPYFIRAELNRRLADNEPATDLVRWLNAQPQVKEVLARQFNGRRITQQNISAWKQGGYRDWERFEESRAQARTFLEEADELVGELFDPEEVAGDHGSLLDRMGDRMALSLLQLFRETELRESGSDRTRDLLHIAREMASLRRGDHQRQRTALAQQRALEQKLRAAEEEEKERINAAIMEREFLRDQVHRYHSEYLFGLAKGDLSMDRHEKLSTFFWQNDERIKLHGFPRLPDGQELIETVKKIRQRLGIEKPEAEGQEPSVEEEGADPGSADHGGRVASVAKTGEAPLGPKDIGTRKTEAAIATETAPPATEKIQPSPAFTNLHQAPDSPPAPGDCEINRAVAVSESF